MNSRELILDSGNQKDIVTQLVRACGGFLKDMSSNRTLGLLFIICNLCRIFLSNIEDPNDLIESRKIDN